MNLKDRRKQIGLTQVQLAKKVGVTQKTVYTWEKGYSHPTINHMLVLSELFHCTMDELLKPGQKNG